MQLASETLVLREQLMRNKVDSRTVGAALLATREELRAAFSREQACEEGYSALLAELDSCRVSQEFLGQHLPPLTNAGGPVFRHHKGAAPICQEKSCQGVLSVLQASASRYVRCETAK